MHLLNRSLVGVLTLVFAINLAHAQDDEYAKIRALVSQQLGKQVTDIKPSPLPGLFQVTAPPMVFYMSKDARYVINGDIIDLEKKLNLSSSERDTAKKTAIEQIGEKDMIVFAPKEVKHTITVFTDIDCGYCRKLHSEMAEYNKLGIKVRYLAYPRAGLGSDSYNKAVSVWCAKDRKKAITEAKINNRIEQKTCTNPVAREFELGQELGVNGTPALVLENGQIYPGYAPADKLIQVLDQVKSQLSLKQ